jgi:hypothetical protein
MQSDNSGDEALDWDSAPVDWETDIGVGHDPRPGSLGCCDTSGGTAAPVSVAAPTFRKHLCLLGQVGHVS